MIGDGMMLELSPSNREAILQSSGVIFDTECGDWHCSSPLCNVLGVGDTPEEARQVFEEMLDDSIEYDTKRRQQKEQLEILEGALDVVADLILFLESDLADYRGSDLSEATLDRLAEVNQYMASHNLWEPSRCTAGSTDA